MSYFGDLQGQASKQWQGIANIPYCVLKNWPAFFSFSLVHYIEDMVIAAIPNMSGTSGTLLNAGIRGAREVVSFVTWDEVKAKY